MLVDDSSSFANKDLKGLLLRILERSDQSKHVVSPYALEQR